MTEDILALVKEREKDFKPLYDRMDKDNNFLKQVAYTLKNAKNEVIKDAVSITMNDAKNFADQAKAIMTGATMQAVVEGKGLSDEETTLIEDFDRDIRWEIDERLLNREYQGLYPFLIEQVLFRGRIAARYTSREDKDQFIPDLLPVDSRFLTYEFNVDGLDWASAATTRRKRQIEHEYPEQAYKARDGVDLQVRNFFDSETEIVWIEDTEIKRGKHPYGQPPFIIQRSGGGTMFQDKESLEFTGESILAPNRNLWEEISRTASILQTINMWIIEGAYQFESEAGGDAEPPDYPAGTRKVVSVEPGRGFKQIPLNDIRNATRLFWSVLMGAVQRGSLSNIDYGNLSFPLSAVAISKLTATKDAIFVPRLQAISLFYRQLFRLVAKQYIKGGKSVELGEEGLKKEYKIADIDKKFSIKYAFYSNSQEQSIADTALGQQQAALGMSRHTIFTQTLKLQNPDGEIDKWRDEIAEKQDIAISLYRSLHSLIERADQTGDDSRRLEAELLLQQLENILRQRAMGRVDMPPEEKGSGQVKPMIPLMAGGGGGNGSGMEDLSPDDMENRLERRGETVRKLAEEG